MPKQKSKTEKAYSALKPKKEAKSFKIKADPPGTRSLTETFKPSRSDPYQPPTGMTSDENLEGSMLGYNPYPKPPMHILKEAGQVGGGKKRSDIRPNRRVPLQIERFRRRV